MGRGVSIPIVKLIRGLMGCDTYHRIRFKVERRCSVIASLFNLAKQEEVRGLCTSCFVLSEAGLGSWTAWNLFFSHLFFSSFLLLNFILFPSTTTLICGSNYHSAEYFHLSAQPLSHRMLSQYSVAPHQHGPQFVHGLMTSRLQLFVTPC